MNSFRSWIQERTDHVLQGGTISREDGLRMLGAEGPDCMDLFAGANRIRHSLAGADVHFCSIINIKSGRCSEDCGFCSQSAHFDTDVEEFPLVGPQEVLDALEQASKAGAEALGLVAAWKGLKPGPSLDSVLEAIRKAKEEGEAVHMDASLGIIDDPEVARALAEAGLHTYNHNLETSRSFFPQVCGSHPYQARVQTLKLLGEAGVRRCSGGIFNMGESHEDRVDLALTLRELGVEVIPLNFLNPLPGTPLGDRPLLAPMDCLRIIATFRFALPDRQLMVAGGREQNLGELQPLMFFAGASHALTGDYLTTSGRGPEQDHALLQELELRATRGPAKAQKKLTVLPEAP